jgi:HEAT repeat protein
MTAMNRVTTFYCPNCWTEVSEQATTCPYCYEDISERISEANYIDKLIAAWILGELREARAMPTLIKIARKANDAFLVESAVEALGKIGGDAATTAVRAATQHSSLRVRVKVRDVLKALVSRNGRDLNTPR